MESWTVQWMAFNSIIFIIAVFVQWQLLLEHPEAHSRCLRKMSFSKFICMGCKARMYLERLLPASSNKANVLSGNPFWSQTEIFFASCELLGLENKGKFWIKLGTQTDFITTKQFGPYLLFIFDRHFFMLRLSGFLNCAKVSTVFLFQMTMMSVTHLWVVLCFWDSLLQPF